VTVSEQSEQGEGEKISRANRKRQTPILQGSSDLFDEDIAVFHAALHKIRPDLDAGFGHHARGIATLDVGLAEDGGRGGVKPQSSGAMPVTE
jgi:hypothetical protein